CLVLAPSLLGLEEERQFPRAEERVDLALVVVAADVACPAVVSHRADGVQDGDEVGFYGLDVVTDVASGFGIELFTADVEQLRHEGLLRGQAGVARVEHVEVGGARYDVHAERPVARSAGEADQDGVERTVFAFGEELVDEQVEVDGLDLDVNADLAGAVSEEPG